MIEDRCAAAPGIENRKKLLSEGIILQSDIDKVSKK